MLCLFGSSVGLTARAGAVQKQAHSQCWRRSLTKPVEVLFLHLVMAGRQFFWCGGFEGALNDSLFVLELVRSRNTAKTVNDFIFSIALNIFHITSYSNGMYYIKCIMILKNQFSLLKYCLLMNGKRQYTQFISFCTWQMVLCALPRGALDNR